MVTLPVKPKPAMTKQVQMMPQDTCGQHLCHGKCEANEVGSRHQYRQEAQQFPAPEDARTFRPVAQFRFISGFSFVQQAEDAEALAEFQFRPVRRRLPGVG